MNDLINTANLSKEKLNTIIELLDQAAMCINSVECELAHDDLLKYLILKPDAKYPTLWCQIYSLEKMFKEANEIELETELLTETEKEF